MRAATAGLSHLEGAQRGGVTERDGAGQPLSDRHLDSELLGQFPRQRLGVCLTRGDLPTGQLPASGQLGWPAALRDKKFAAHDQRPGDDDLVLHGSKTVYGRAMAVLSDDDVDAALSDLGGWERVDNALRRSVKFPAFLAGIDAVGRVADAAEAADHHPDIDIRWRTVTFTLSTHSEGGITQKDLALAKQIDEIVGQ